jgi:hypothetical protein
LQVVGPATLALVEFDYHLAQREQVEAGIGQVQRGAAAVEQPGRAPGPVVSAVRRLPLTSFCV